MTSEQQPKAPATAAGRSGPYDVIIIGAGISGMYQLHRVRELGLSVRVFEAGEHDFDMIIYATGFDAITGAFDRIDFRGLGGRRLKDKWSDGPRTYLGLQIEGFPNLFTLVGPHNAATFCNIPRCIEQNVDWVTALLRHMRDNGHARVEAIAEAERGWTEHVYETGRRMLFTKVDSWMMGINGNVPGKQKPTLVVYAGGVPKYRDKCDEVAARGYVGFTFR